MQTADFILILLGPFIHMHFRKYWLNDVVFFLLFLSV
jgi:hypothetical protein